MKLFKPKTHLYNQYFYSISDIGVIRKKNEDYVYHGCNKVLDYLLIVCDGVGSYKGSDFASKITTEAFCHSFHHCDYVAIDKKEWFLKTIQKAKITMQDHVLDYEDHYLMCTTLVMALIEKNSVSLFWIGDSRAYLLTKNKASQLTIDHNVLNMLLAEKQDPVVINAYKSQWLAITKCVQMDLKKPQEFDCHFFKLKPNELLFLATDGFYNFFDCNKLYKIITSNKDSNISGKQLVKDAILNESNDNISFAYYGLVK